MASLGVIMRTKNRPVLLKRAIASVLSQTHSDWHLVIVNDGGEADAVDALVAATDPVSAGRIQVVHHAQSVGMEAASNAGLRNLATDYVMVHDDDDSLHPEFFAKTLAYLQAPPHPSVRGVITKTERVIERLSENDVQEVRRFPYNDWVKTVNFRKMLAANFFAPIAFVFCRQACLDAGAFREDLPVLGDWDFNIRFLQHYEIGVLHETLAYYHDREQVSYGDYASSVSGKAHLHEFYDNLLRNEWLRKDIAAGKTGVGVWANNAPALWDLTWDIRQEIKSNKFRLFGNK